MKRLGTFLAVAVLTLSCWMSVPSKAYAQGIWSGWGPGYYGWGGYGSGPWGWRGYGLGGSGAGFGGAPWYLNYSALPYYGYARSYYPLTPSYYATPNYYRRADPIDPAYITTTSTTGTTRANQGRQPNRAYIYVEVPANAQVFFNNTPMRQQGSRREFMTPPLQPNATGYTFEVTARWTENGKEHRDTRLIHVTPGGTTDVNFLADQDHVIPASTQSAPAAQGQVATPSPRSPSDGK